MEEIHVDNCVHALMVLFSSPADDDLLLPLTPHHLLLLPLHDSVRAQSAHDASPLIHVISPH